MLKKPSKKTQRQATHNSAQTIEQRVVGILRKLNPQTPEHELKQYALRLHITARLGAIADLPRARNSGGRIASRELATMARHAKKLATQMRGLHRDALIAFERVENRGGLHPILMAKELLVLADAAMRAQKDMPDTPPHRGNRPKRQAQEVTRQARTMYERLTGKASGRATDAYRNGRPYGPLHDFLTELFTLLQIQASSDAQLKTLLSVPRRINAPKIVR